MHFNDTLDVVFICFCMAYPSAPTAYLLACDIEQHLAEQHLNLKPCAPHLYFVVVYVYAALILVVWCSFGKHLYPSTYKQSQTEWQNRCVAACFYQTTDNSIHCSFKNKTPHHNMWLQFIWYGLISVAAAIAIVVVASLLCTWCCCCTILVAQNNM